MIPYILFVLLFVAASKAIPDKVFELFVFVPLAKVISNPLTVVAPTAAEESVTFNV